MANPFKSWLRKTRNKKRSILANTAYHTGKAPSRVNAYEMSKYGNKKPKSRVGRQSQRSVKRTQAFGRTKTRSW